VAGSRYPVDSSEIEARSQAFSMIMVARLLLAALLLALTFAGEAPGQSPPGLLISLRSATGAAVSYFKLQAHDGQQITAGMIDLANPTGTSMRVVLDPVDAQTTNTLGSAYLLPGSAEHESTEWTRLSERNVTVGPHQRVDVALDIDVSSSASAGDYLSGISIEAPQPHAASAPAKHLSVVSTERYAIGVEVSIPGSRHPLLRFTGVRAQREPAGLSFDLLASNPGNVILQNVHGQASVRREGRLVASTPIGPGTFVTHTAIAFPVRALREMPREGAVYHVQATMHYQGGTAHISTNVSFGHRQAVAQALYGGPPASASGFSPWWRWPLIAALATVLICGIDHYLLARRRKRRDSSPESHRPAPLSDSSGLSRDAARW